MKLTFIGTGAADFDIKAPLDAVNYRRFSSLLINDELLVDCGPCVFEGGEARLSVVKAVIQTHLHRDHYSPVNIERLGRPMYKRSDFTLYEPKLLECGYSVTALEANHDRAAEPVHYVIEAPNGDRIFYGCDGAWLYNRTAAYLHRLSFNAMIFDCTLGDIEGDFRIFEHNSLPMVELMKSAFAGNSNTFITSHMARTLHPSREETIKRAARSGIIAAFDGFEIEV